MPLDVTLRNPGTGFDVALADAAPAGPLVVRAYVGGQWQAVGMRVHGGGAWPGVSVGAHVGGQWRKSVAPGAYVPPPSGVSYSDNFDGTAALAQPPWFTYYDWAIDRSVSGMVRASHPWGDPVYTSEMTTSDMYVEAVIDLRAGTYTDGIGPAARYYPNSNGTYEGYALRLMRYDNTNLKWKLERNGADVVGITQTAIDASSGVLVTARLEVTGGTVVAKLNGTTVHTYVDPSPLTRRTGGLVLHDVSAAATSWSAGDP